MNLKEELITPYKASYDVIVCGGGVAGCAAAVAVAREGLSVLLIEKSILLGGLATNGLISWFEPICDGHGRKLIYGMADELLQLSIRDADDTLPEQWRDNPDRAETERRFATLFSPTMFSMALDNWLISGAVNILLDTVVVRPIMEMRKCSGLIVENKGGRFWYGAKAIIDCTGDLDIMDRAGAESELGKNYLTYIGYVVDSDTLDKAKTSGNLLSSRRWTSKGSDLWGKGHPENAPPLSGVTAEEVTEYVLSGRKIFYDSIRKSGRKERDVTILPGMAQFRTTRRLKGVYELKHKDEGKYFEDSVGVVCDFSKPGSLYEVPYRTLYSEMCDNIWTAGRTISSSGWAWEVTRVIPVAILSGQASGLAATVAIRTSTIAANVDVRQVQGKLRQSGIILHSNE